MNNISIYTNPTEQAKTDAKKTLETLSKNKLVKLPPDWDEDLFITLTETIFRTETVSEEEEMMVDTICDILDDHNIKYKVDKHWNIVTQPVHTNPIPGICCHIDTVHPILPLRTPLKIEITEKLILPGNNSSGVGGDDKCGIVIALYTAIKSKKQAKYFFFASEEIGSIGAKAMNSNEFKNISTFIQFDRKNSHDIIRRYSGTDTTNYSFDGDTKNTFKKFGYSLANGSVTDVISLWNKNIIEVSVVNLSCGYYNPHTFSEYVVIDSLKQATILAGELITTLKNKMYTHKHQTTDYSSTWTSYQNYKPSPKKAKILNLLDTHYLNNSVIMQSDTTNNLIAETTQKCPLCGEYLSRHTFTFECYSCETTFITPTSKTKGETKYDSGI